MGFSDGSTSLSGSGTSLELRFRGCSGDGLLLYAGDSSEREYFAIGLLDGQLLVEYRTRGGNVSEVGLHKTFSVSSLTLPPPPPSSLLLPLSLSSSPSISTHRLLLRVVNSFLEFGIQLS